ncbi:hypothetical protein [Asanoa iriomotensis]|uniref:hypothetical protein n=1 Tax=Asanoa iriomotensis TaxID=234613 RepID=UPI0031E260B4
MALVRDQLPTWRRRWRDGPPATGEQLDRLAEGGFHHLHDGEVTVLGPPPDRGYGMCGRLTTYQT